MASAPLYTVDGKKKSFTLKKEIFTVSASEGLLHESVRRIRAAERRGTASTKTRSEAAGGGSKPWRQKGTGRARAGTIRSPIWKGGGVAFGPHPRDFRFDLPKRQRRRALAAALAARANENELIILDATGLTEPKTKTGVALLATLGVQDKRVSLAHLRDETALAKSVRNLPNIRLAEAEGLNPYHVLTGDVFVLTKNAYDHVIEVLMRHATS